MTSPSSIRFEPDVLRRLNAYVAAHPGTTLSSAGNRLVDEALRSHDHPSVIFRDGPAGRRARLVGGPDVRSETANVYEIGYRGQPAASVSFSVTAFRAAYDHLRTQEIAPSRTLAK